MGPFGSGPRRVASIINQIENDSYEYNAEAQGKPDLNFFANDWGNERREKIRERTETWMLNGLKTANRPLSFFGIGWSRTIGSSMTGKVKSAKGFISADGTSGKAIASTSLNWIKGWSNLKHQPSIMQVPFLLEAPTMQLVGLVFYSLSLSLRRKSTCFKVRINLTTVHRKHVSWTHVKFMDSPRILHNSTKIPWWEWFPWVGSIFRAIIPSIC